MQLVWPSSAYLDSYVAALERGWSPDNVRGAAAARDILEQIARDPAAYLASRVDRDAASRPLTLPYVEVTTDTDNVPSRRVIESNGGVLVERFVKPPQFGSVAGLRYRIPLLTVPETSP